MWKPCFVKFGHILFLSTVVPVVTITPMNQTVVSPNTTTFNCSATAKPQAEIQWMRNGMLLGNTVDNTTKITIIGIAQGDCNITRPPSECVLTSTLMLTGTIPDNVGEYVCTASNPAGSDMKTASLTVHGIYIAIILTFAKFLNKDNSLALI